MSDIQIRNISIATHPEYDENLALWVQMRTTAAGETAVKNSAEQSLPKTPGQARDRKYGQIDYEYYKQRSIFYDYVADTIKDSLGLLHKESVKAMSNEALITKYFAMPTSEKEDLDTFMRRIHENQLVTGRCGLLLDVDGNGEPKSVLYPAERILNWDSENIEPRWVIFDESDYILDGMTLEYTWEKSYRLVALDANDRYYTVVFDEWSPAFLTVSEGSEGAIYPTVVGRTYDKLPFTFCNAGSIISTVDKPPLLAVSNVALSIYRNEADRQQQLFLQAQETPLLKGFKTEDDIEFGAGVAVYSSNTDASIEYVGINGNGLAEARENIEALKTYASNLGIELNENGSESGTALNTRLTIRTSSLQTIAKTSQAAIQNQLYHIIRWFGLSDSDTNVMVNLDFSSNEQKVQDMKTMWEVVQSGGLSIRDYWSYLAENDYTSLSYEDWRQTLKDDLALLR